MARAESRVEMNESAGQDDDWLADSKMTTIIIEEFGYVRTALHCRSLN